MVTASQNYFNLGNTKTITKTLLPSLELTILIIDLFSTNLKIALKTLQIENFKRHLMIKNTPCYTTSSDSKDIIQILICKNCNNFCLEQTQNFKQRTAKHKSDVKNPYNSTCRICSEHLRDCNQIEPCFQIFPFYYETNTAVRGYKEKRYILS